MLTAFVVAVFGFLASEIWSKWFSSWDTEEESVACSVVEGMRGDEGDPATIVGSVARAKNAAAFPVGSNATLHTKRSQCQSDFTISVPYL